MRSEIQPCELRFVATLAQVPDTQKLLEKLNAGVKTVKIMRSNPSEAGLEVRFLHEVGPGSHDDQEIPSEPPSEDHFAKLNVNGSSVIL